MSINSTSTGGTSDADSYTVNGTAGAGFVQLPLQSTMTPAPSGGVRIFSDAAGDFTLIDDQVNSVSLSLSGLSLPRTYTFPDTSDQLVSETSTQILTNKTILSSGGNIVDATSINGETLSGAPTAGQYLKYNGVDWTPQTISGASPVSFTGDIISIIVGAVGGVASFTDERFTNPQVAEVRSGTPGYGQFTSVAAAIASITDASTTKRYVIYVGAGVFLEPAMTLKPFVYIRGANKLATVIRPASSGITLFTACNNSSIEECMLYGDGTGTGLLVDSCSTAIFTNLTAMNFNTIALFSSSAAPTDVLLHEFLFYGPCQYGVVVDGTAATSSYLSNVAISMGRMRGDATVQQAFRFVGPYARVGCNTTRATNCTAGTGVYIDDSAYVVFTTGNVGLCQTGVQIANVGGGPTAYFSNALLLNNTQDVTVSHPGATGLFGGVADKNKITIDPTATIVMSYTDISSPANIITGEFYYAPSNDTVLTETGSLLVYGAPIGCYNGGTVSAGVGLNVNVDPGLGYIEATASIAEYVRKIEWGASVVLATDNATTYVYADETGVHVAGGVPDLITNVILARVVASGGAIEFIDNQLQSNYHPATKDFIMDRDTDAPTFAAGCIASIGAGSTVDLTAGVYYYLHNRFAPPGGTGITMRGYWQNGSGGWNIADVTTLTATYDVGGGSLGPVPSGQWARYVLFVVGDASTYLLLYGQATFSTELQASADPTTVAPTQFTDGVAVMATITVSSAGVLTVRDVRKTKNSEGVGSVVATVIDHGSLAGLSHDDHLQYLLCNGTRAMQGSLSMGGFDVTNVGLVDGVDVSLHGSRHLPNGADPLVTAAPLSSLSSISTNAEGTANSYARSDHSHAIDLTGFSINSLTGTLTVSRGGTGLGTLTSGRVLIGAGTSNVDLTKAAPTGTFVGTTDTQTLDNKTLTAASTTIRGATGSDSVTFSPTGATNIITTGPAAVTVPAGTNTLVARDTTDTLTNKTLRGGLNGNNVYANFLANPSNPVILPTSAPSFTGAVLVIAGVPNAVWGNINSISGVLNVPNGGTGRSTLTSNGVLVGNGIGNVDSTKLAPVGDFVGTTDAQSLSNKTLAAATTTIAAAGAGNTLTFSPTGATSLVTAGPATVTLPSGTRTLVARDTTDTLTGKTITDVSNTVAAIQLRYASGTVSMAAAPVPSSGQVLTATSATTAQWADPTPLSSVPDNTFYIYDNVDSTIQIRFDAAGTTGTATTLVSQQTANASLILPGASDTLVGRATVDTLSNKTLTLPVISSISNGGTLTLPSATDTLVGRSTVDTLQNKTLVDSSTVVSGTGTIAFTAGGTSSTTIVAGSAVPATLTLPITTDTLVGRNTTDTLQNKTLSMSSTAITDTSSRSYNFTSGGTGSTTVTITSAATASRTLTLPNITDTLVTKTSTDTLTNKSITGGTGGNTVAANLVRAVTISAVAPTVGQTLVATTTTTAAWATPSVTTVTGILPVANGGTGLSSLTSGQVLVGGGASVDLTKAAPSGAFVGTTDTQTMSNKTLTLPVISSISNGGTLTLPSTTDTLVARDTTDVLANKTLSYTTSNIDVNKITGVTVTGTPVAGNGLYADGVGGAAWGALNLGGANSVVGTLTVAHGGTGAASLTSGNLLTGNGTGAIQSTTAIPLGGLVGRTAAQTLSSKNLDAATTTFDGVTPGVDSLTFTPSGFDQLVFTGATTATVPAGNVTLVARNSTDVLTNKTLTSPTNTVAAKQLWTVSGTLDVSAATAPTAGQVLTAVSGVAATWQNPVATTTFSDAAFNIYNSGDPTSTITFAALGATGTTVLINATQSTNISIDLPSVSATLVGRNTFETLLNKTLVTPVISSITNVGTLTLPTGPDTIVARTSTDTLTGKTITDSSNTVAAKLLTTATGTVNIGTAPAPTAGQVLTAVSGTAGAWSTPSVAAVTGTLAVTNGGTGATSFTVGNVLLGNGTSAFTALKAAPTGAFVGTTDAQVLTGKIIVGSVLGNDIAANRLFSVNITNTIPTAGQTLTATSGTDAAWTTPSVATVTGTLAVANGGTGATTLTSGNVLVGAGTSAVTTTKVAPTGAFVGTTDTQTLTNKTLDGTVAGNDVAANRILAVNVNTTPPTAGQILTATSATAAQWSAAPAGLSFMNSTFLITATTTAATNVTGNNANSSIAYPGSATVGITAFRVVASMNNNAASYTIRVRDITNALTIASVTVNVTGATIYTTTAISNVPAAAAILRIEALKSATGTTTLTMQGWNLQFG